METRERHNGRLWLIALLGLIALVFILLNSQDVKIKFVVATTTAPLIVALAISTVLGLLVGYMMGRLHNHDRRARDD